MTAYQIVQIRPTPFPLGRHVNFDPRSQDYPYEPQLRGVVLGPTRTRHHRLYGGILRQRVGNCTLNALAYSLNSEPNRKKGQHPYKEPWCEERYEEVTARDPFPGQWFRDGRQGSEDTGSDETTAAQVAKEHGELTRYEHVELTSANLVMVLQERAGNIGVNYYDSMFEPDSGGFVEIKPGARVAGGHEMSVLGVNVEDKYFSIPQSWGRDFGINGWIRMSFATIDRLGKEDGDLVVPIV